MMLLLGGYWCKFIIFVIGSESTMRIIVVKVYASRFYTCPAADTGVDMYVQIQ